MPPPCKLSSIARVSLQSALGVGGRRGAITIYGPMVERLYSGADYLSENNLKNSSTARNPASSIEYVTP